MKQNESNKKLVVFVTSFVSEMLPIHDLLVILGKGKEAKKIYIEYDRMRKFFGPWGTEALAKLYQESHIDKLKELASDYCRTNLLEGIREFTLGLKERGVLVGALAPYPQFLFDVAKEKVGFDFAFGTELEFERGIATGNFLKEMNRYERAKLIREKRKEFNIAKENTIVIGKPSIVDIPAIQESNFFIGFDPKEGLHNIARKIVTDKRLRKIFLG